MFRYPRLLQRNDLPIVSKKFILSYLVSGGISEITLIPDPPLVKVTISASLSNSLIMDSGSSVVRHFRCGQLFITGAAHGAHSTFWVTTVTFLPRGDHWLTLDGPNSTKLTTFRAAAR
jgi:hypothetical protein